MITIVDYGMGNLGSVQNMLRYIEVESEITADLEKIAAANKILLPGVGAFDAAMQKIRDHGIEQGVAIRTVHDGMVRSSEMYRMPTRAHHEIWCIGMAIHLDSFQHTFIATLRGEDPGDGSKRA